MQIVARVLTRSAFGFEEHKWLWASVCERVRRPGTGRGWGGKGCQGCGQASRDDEKREGQFECSIIHNPWLPSATLHTPLQPSTASLNNLHHPGTSCVLCGLCMGCVYGLSLRGKKKDLRNANRNERSRGRSLLPGHGTFSNSKVGGWRLAVGGGWRRLVVGGWWLGGVGGWWGLAVGSG